MGSGQSKGKAAAFSNGDGEGPGPNDESAEAPHDDPSTALDAIINQTDEIPDDVDVPSALRYRYHIKTLLGSGNFSEVFRVEHKLTRRPYAMKLHEKGPSKLDDSLSKELEVLKFVDHPNIVKIQEVFEGNGHIFMVMELATGGELFDRIVERGKFTERDASRVVDMILSGLLYLHEQNIAHRDLKPENILYYHPGADSKVMITDFGLSKIRQDVYKSDSIGARAHVGTPEYVAPEILLNRGFTKAVDMWSVGVITFILLCGYYPFDDKDHNRLFKKITMADFKFSSPYWDGISDSAKHFITHLLQIDPEARFPADEARRHIWARGHGAPERNIHGSVKDHLMKRQFPDSQGARKWHSQGINHDEATDDNLDETEMVRHDSSRPGSSHAWY